MSTWSKVKNCQDCQNCQTCQDWQEGLNCQEWQKCQYLKIAKIAPSASIVYHFWYFFRGEGGSNWVNREHPSLSVRATYKFEWYAVCPQVVWSKKRQCTLVTIFKKGSRWRISKHALHWLQSVSSRGHFFKNFSLGVFLLPFYVQKWHNKFEKSWIMFSWLETGFKNTPVLPLC